jgi:ethanolamine transporter EutH
MLGRLVMGSFVGKILVAVYVVVGLIVASSHHYLAHLGAVKPIVSAVLGVLLWPLVLFGVNLRIR